jgi:hypothetical protein
VELMPSTPMSGTPMRPNHMSRRMDGPHLTRRR